MDVKTSALVDNIAECSSGTAGIQIHIVNVFVCVYV